jgi:SAM-dependent methyltransferase
VIREGVFSLEKCNRIDLTLILLRELAENRERLLEMAWPRTGLFSSLPGGPSPERCSMTLSTTSKPDAAADPSRTRFLQYLAAKKSVDDRSLNQRVWDTLRQTLAPSELQRPVTIFEAGCGIGTMIERLIDWELIPNGRYTGVDAAPDCLAEALGRLRRFGARPGLEIIEEGADRIAIRSRCCSLMIELVAMDLVDYLKSNGDSRTFDLIIAHAFLDLVELRTALPLLLSSVRHGGLCYFTLNFDGMTVFEPVMDRALDKEIERLYHETMDRRYGGGRGTGGSRTGRTLLTTLRDHGVRIIDSGSSDWLCFAREGSYEGRESFFLHFIVDTVEKALSGNPDLDQQRFLQWVDKRHEQIDRGELIYIAHQLDVLGQVIGPPETIQKSIF